MYCFNCFEFADKRSLAVLMIHDEDKFLIEPYDTLGVPYCKEKCHKYFEENKDKFNIKEALEKCLDAMDKFPWEVLEGDE